MESQSETTQTVSALKLLVLKTRDYDLWSMRIEQYLTHTNYALWEVIVNGDAPAIASTSIEGLIPLKIAKQKLARKNELKAKSTLLLAIPDEHLLKFHGIEDAKTIWEAIKTRFGGNKESNKMQKTILKEQYENFTASRSEGLYKTYDSQSNSQELDNKDLEQIDIDDLEEMNLKWQVAMLTIRVKRFLKKTGRNLNFNGKETVGFDKTKVECYNCHMRGHFARECRAPRNQGNRNRDVPRRIIPVETPVNALVVQDGICGYDWSFQAEEGPTDFALMAHLSSGSSSSSSSDSELKNQLAEALREKDDLKLKLENQITKNKLHDIHKNNSKVFESASENSVNEIEEENNQVNDRFKKVEGYHVVLPPYTGNYMPSRPDLSFARLDDSVYKTNVSETITSVPRNVSTISKFSKDNLEQPKDVRPSTPIVEEWQSDSDDDCVTRPLIEQNKPILTKSGNVLVNTAKQSSSRAAVSNSTARYVNTAASRPTMNGEKPCLNVNNVTTAGTKAVVSDVQGHEENVVKSSACWGNPQYALQDQGIFDSGCSRHITGNKSYLTDYQDIDGGFVTFVGSHK
ncbi:ribonuclease H-like domain-containing protein [Tanacetum coccineum]